jgi:translocation and assembly module TamB
VVSFLRRKFTLGRIILDHPAFAMRIDSQGHSNLPETPTPALAAPPGTSAAKIFDMAIQSVIVNSGWIDYNDEQTPLSAQLNNFRVQAAFNNFTHEYKSSIAYDRGRLAFKDFNPIVHDTQIQLTASRSGIVVEQLAWKTAGSSLTVNGTISNYAAPAVQASYQGSVQTRELAQIFKNSAILAGNVALHGTIRYESGTNKPFIDAVIANGAADSAALLVPLGEHSVQTRSVRATYRIEGGNLYVENATADLLGGRAAGNFQMLHLAGAPASKFDATLKNVSLGETSRAFLLKTSQVRVVGQANVTAQGAWTNDIRNLSGHANLVVTGPLQPGPPQPTIGGPMIPVNARIDVRYDGARSAADFDHSYIRTTAADVSLTGTLSNHSALNVEANSSDLRELTAFIVAIQNGNAPARGQSPDTLQTLALSGAAHFNGQVLGSTKSPRLVGQISAENFEVAGSHWRALKTNLDLSSTAIALKDASLTDNQQGQINLNARVSLSNWSFTPTSAVVAQLAAAHMSIADLQRLAGVHYPVAGDLSANISFDGTERNPSGHGSLTVTKASAWNESIANLAVEFQGDGNSIHSTAQVRAAAGNLSANLGYSPRTQEYDIAVNMPGVDLAKVHAVAERNTGIAGTLTGSVNGRGTFSDPQLDANLRIASLHVRDRTIEQVQAQLGVARQHATFTLRSNLEQGTLQVQGDADLQGDRMANADVNIHALPIGLLLASYLPAGGPHFGGQTDVHATIHGPLSEPSRMEAHVDIPALSVGYQSLEVAAVHPIQIDYRSGIITLQPTEMKGSGTDLNLRGSVPIKNAAPSTASMDASAKGTIDLTILKGFTADLKSSGQVDLDISARGDLSHPVTQGHARITNAAVSSANIPVGFEMLNVEVDMNGNRVDLSRLSATAGGGSVSATGFMIYGSQSNFNMSLTAKSVRVRYPEGVRSVVDANVQFAGTPASSELSGRVLVDRLSFTQGFDMASFLGQFSDESAPPSSSPFQQNMKLNVAVQTAQELNAESSQLSVEGSANLNVGGTLANPVILGRTALTGGDIFFMGKRYVVQNGTIEFANPVRTQPVLNVFMNTTVQQYNITLNFVGPVDRLRTNYTSTPALPPADIINLIAFGKTAEQQATGPSTPPAVGAESVLAQGVSGQVSGRIEKLAGISQLTIDPLASNNSRDPGSQVAIQQRINGSLLFTFSTNVTSTQNQTVQLHYQANKNLSMSVLRDRNGGYAIDVRVRRTF